VAVGSVVNWLLFLLVVAAVVIATFFGSAKSGLLLGLVVAAIVGVALVCLLRRIRREKVGARGKITTAVLSVVAIVLALLLLLILSELAKTVYTYTRNYYGYCTRKTDGRYLKVPVERDGIIQSCTISPLAKDLRGRRFTTEERLDLAINHYLCSLQYWDYNAIGAAEGMRSAWDDDIDKQFTLLYYDSKDEFLRENPDCCQLTWRSSEGDEFPVWETGVDVGNGLVNGIGNGMFKFNHKVRYLDRQGTRKEIDSTGYIRVNNCGYSSP